MPTVERVADLVRLVEDGKFVEGLETFYHPESTMQENNDPPRTNRAESIERQKRNLQYGATVGPIRANSVLIDGDLVAVEWHADWSLPDGRHFHVEEVALQRWRGDRIIAERFFYDPEPLQELARL